MKSYLILLLFLPSIGWSQQNAPNPITMNQITRTDSKIDTTLAQDEAIFVFKFTGIGEQDSIFPISYHLGNEEYFDTIINNQLRVKTIPGIQTFSLNMQHYKSSIGYTNIGAIPLEAKKQTVTSFSVFIISYLKDTSIESIKIDTSIQVRHTLCKPVIYLYPEKKQDVSVSLNIKGATPVFYPNYQHSWEFTAHPNGNLNFQDAVYRYLFWESEEEDHLTEIEVNEGFVVDGSASIEFLEEKLNLFGLTSEERADFITYWGPKLMGNSKNLVRFEWNETCDKFAELTIVPQPDNIYRLYIFIAPIETDLQIRAQEIPQIDRSGFVVIEWGGQISDYQPKSSL